MHWDLKFEVPVLHCPWPHQRRPRVLALSYGASAGLPAYFVWRRACRRFSPRTAHRRPTLARRHIPVSAQICGAK